MIDWMYMRGQSIKLKEVISVIDWMYMCDQSIHVWLEQQNEGGDNIIYGGVNVQLEKIQVSAIAEYGNSMAVSGDHSSTTTITGRFSDQPGKPIATNVTHESVQLEWAKPTKHGTQSIVSYTVLYYSSVDPPD